MTTPTLITAGELVHINPADVHLGDNVRTEASVGIPFVDSIRQHGVLQPISAIRRNDGILEVRDGQRRTLAAREAGLVSIPVYITTATVGDAAVTTVERITHQLVTNDQRENLTTSQRIGAVEQMLNLGVTPVKAAKALGMKRGEVEAVAVTVKSERARREAEDGTLTLEQAAALAEFEDDERAIEKLMYAARGHRFDHTVSYLRQQRAERARIAEFAKPYIERGFTLLPERPYNFYGTPMQPLSWLHTAEGVKATEDDITDPALWSVSIEEDIFYTDTKTDEPVSEEEIDWHITDPSQHTDYDYDDDAELDAEGYEREHLVPAYRVATRYDYTPSFYCNDLAATGLL